MNKLVFSLITILLILALATSISVGHVAYAEEYLPDDPIDEGDVLGDKIQHEESGNDIWDYVIIGAVFAVVIGSMFLTRFLLRHKKKSEQSDLQSESNEIK
ncbi:MAG: hypothetical protein PHX51_01435 [Clostridia bacterium]|nr:hypothetical protein [Clostridia bacterium]